MTTDSRIRVLVVDDSAFARKVIREILSASPRIVVVGTARDGLEALERVIELKPDVITLDLVMPNLDGVGVLRALPQAGRPRVIVVSISDGNSDLGVEALQAGAIDIVQKPTALATDRLFELADELTKKVIIAASASAGREESPSSTGVIPSPLHGRIRIVVIGTSTGGPQALSRLIPALPGDLPVPVAVALHIPAGYTDALSRRLDAASALRVVEATISKTELTPGLAVIARGGTHLVITRGERGPAAELDFSAQKSPYTPSVDLLFWTAADVYGDGVLGVVLTGMGDDGLLGSRAIRDAGGAVLVESAMSCIVDGMPRAVRSAGLAVGEAPLTSMATRIASML